MKDQIEERSSQLLRNLSNEYFDGMMWRVACCHGIPWDYLAVWRGILVILSVSLLVCYFFFVQVLLYKGFLVQFCQRVFCNFSLGSGATALDGEFVFTTVFFLATSKVFRIWRGTI